MSTASKPKIIRPKKYELTIGWLYPELMSTYGDRGNVLILENRIAWRGMNARVKKIDFATTPSELKSCDIILGGGAQDRQQTIMVADMRTHKGATLRAMFDAGIPELFVCGSPQLLGHWYMTGDGQKLEGLGIFDMVTKHFGHDKPRCIGNTVGNIGDRFKVSGISYKETIVGFENHGGRTYLGDGVKPFAKVVRGNGNNAEDGTEGAIYNNCIATYYHGPFLAKNPHIADWLISKALEVKYKKVLPLTALDDTLEWQAHDARVTMSATS